MGIFNMTQYDATNSLAQRVGRVSSTKIQHDGTNSIASTKSF
jgi:hypothetical protein